MTIGLRFNLLGAALAALAFAEPAAFDDMRSKKAAPARDLYAMPGRLSVNHRGYGPWLTRSPGWRQSQRRKNRRRTGR